MKTMKYLISVWTTLLISVFLYSCADDYDRTSTGKGDGKTLRLSISAPANKIIDPMTKTDASSSTKDIQNLNVLIYDIDGNLVKNDYISTGLGELGKSESNKYSKSYLLETTSSGTVYVVANAGDLGKELNTVDALKAKYYGLDGNKNPQLIMCSAGNSFNLSNEEPVSVALLRIYSMITVVMERSNLDSETEVIPISAQLKHMPATGTLGSDNKISIATGVTCVLDGELMEGNDDPNFLSSHNEVKAFLMYENMQPEGSDGGLGQKYKTPAGLQPSDIISVIKGDRTCSYIEVKGNYVNNGNPSGAGSGTITYRFFLGKDVLNNFEVERNVHYKVTLSLHGKGGVDEATWRVEADLIGQINVEDVYVGYRYGSVSYIPVSVKGDGELVLKTTSNGDFKLTPKNDASGKLIGVEVEALKTNVHDYEYKECPLEFALIKDGVEVAPKKAKALQVPRLVDPIAYYKKAENWSETDVIVKAFDPVKRSYEVLNSKGPWVAIIESSSEGHSDGSNSSNSWFQIYSDDRKNYASALYETIHGEGPVTFKYKPKGPNMKDDNLVTVNNARYGKIVVKYHNSFCSHEIYVRQGYGPITMDDTDNAWSSYNCLGQDENGIRQITTSPTQSGWLFKGGVNFAMHPYKPEYKKPIGSTILYSDGATGDFNGNTTKGYKGDGDDYSWVIDPKGPCPDGYIVPDADAYASMVRDKMIYTGFVHDDDAEGNSDPESKGWAYEGEKVRLYDNNNCNPAKGVLFIDQNTDKNIFFNFGKGVFTDNKSPLIQEIGVGQRMSYDGSGALNRGGYGAFYWSATSFFGTGNDPGGTGVAGNGNFGKVDFAYDIFSPNPHLIDVPFTKTTSESNIWCIGISPKLNASFVRCLKAEVKTRIIRKEKSLIDGGDVYTETKPYHMISALTCRVNGNKFDVLRNDGNTGELFIDVVGLSDDAVLTFTAEIKYGDNFMMTGGIKTSTVTVTVGEFIKPIYYLNFSIK